MISMTEEQIKEFDFLTSDEDHIYGWTQMDNGVIYCTDITDSEFRTYAVIRSLVNQFKKVAWPSVETVAGLSGHSPRTTQRNIARLVELDLIQKIPRSGSSNNYMVKKHQNSKVLRNEKDIQEWKERHQPKQPEPQKPADPPKEEPKADPIPYTQIINELNYQAGTKFSPKSQANQKLIRARWNEGNGEREFYYVIKVKCDQWKGTDMAQYLRPSTLFGNKFDQYKNESPNQKVIGQTGQAPKDDWKQRFLEGDDE